MEAEKKGKQKHGTLRLPQSMSVTTTRGHEFQAVCNDLFRFSKLTCCAHQYQYD